MKNKNTFMLRFLDEAIVPLADKGYQERVWAKGEGPEVDSYDETINQFYYFFEALEEDFTKYGLTLEQFECVSALEKAIDEHSDLAPVGGMDRDIISHPLWKKVVQSAQLLSKVLARFENDEN